MVDLLIRGGWLVDGTGSPAFRADLAVEGDLLHIVRAASDGLVAAETLDASGLVVAPGFIDVHTHSGLVMLAEPLEEP